MAYFLISSFSSGLDLRRPSLVAPKGTLRKLKNAHITEGGDIEKRYAFGKIADLPANTFGIAGLGNVLYVFQQGAPARTSPPPIPINLGGISTFAALTVNVVTISMPAGKTASHLEDWDIFDDKLYAVIADTDDNFHHFYDGVLVTNNPAVGRVPRNVKTFKSKMYGIVDQTMSFSGIDAPMDWNNGTGPPAVDGAGFIILGNIDGESGTLLGLEVYYDQLAVMSRYATQIWEVDPDPLLNNLKQTLRNAGTLAPRSPKQYGSGDVLYLHDSGIRSLRAKDSSNAAAVSDIGSPLDPVIRQLIKDKTATPDYIYNAFSLIEPNTGRYWLCFPDRIFILSYFPGPKVTAWSEYDPGMTLDGGVIAKGQVVVRSGDALYAYGGVSGSEYDSCKVEVSTPYMDVDLPANTKQFTGIDLAAFAENGAWTIRAGYDPNKPDATDLSTTVYEPSFDEGALGLEGTSSHIALHFVHEAPGAAMLSSIAVHYRSRQGEKAN